MRHLIRKAFFSALGLLACAFGGATLARAETLYQQLSRVIVRLEEPNEKKTLGTAFFVHQVRDGAYYLVTARHVVEPRVQLRSRVPSQRLDDQETDVIELRIPADAWVYHPQGTRKIRFRGQREEVAAVDVAVAKVSAAPAQRRVHMLSYCPAPCADGAQQQFLDADPLPPGSVLVWGFPGNLGFTLTRPRPMARFGIIAMAADEPYVRTDDDLRDERVLLIDARLFGGNSGGPIFFYPRDGPMKLAGLLSATNKSLVYAVAEPVSRIAEAIDAARASAPAAVATWGKLAIETDEDNGD